MSLTLVIAIVSTISALVLYSLGVWGERLGGGLKAWHTTCFWAGLVLDATGTALMSSIAGGMKLNFHGVTGALAFLLMLGNAIWAAAALKNKQAKALKDFHRISLIVWLLWLIPFFSGMAAAMMQ